MRPEASSALIICKVLSRLLFKTKRKVLLPRTLYLDAREGPNGAGGRTSPYATAPQLWSRPVAPPSLIVAVPMTCGVCKKRVLERCVFDIVTFWWWAQPALYVIGASGPSGGRVECHHAKLPFGDVLERSRRSRNCRVMNECNCRWS